MADQDQNVQQETAPADLTPGSQAETEGRAEMAELNETKAEAQAVQENSDGAGANNKSGRDKTLYELKQDLRVRESDIQGSQADVDNLKKETSALQADIKSLGQSSQEIDKVVEDFEKAREDMQAQLDALHRDANEKRATLEKMLADDVTEVDEDGKKVPKPVMKAIEDYVVKEVDGKINEIEDKVNQLGSKKKLQVEGCPETKPELQFVQCAEIQQENAESGPKGLTVMEKAYNDCKGHQKKTESSLKAAEELRKQAEKAEDEGKYRIEYYYLLELEKKLDEIAPDEDGQRKIIESEVLRGELDDAWVKWAEAKSTLRIAQQNLNELRAELETNRNDLDRAKGNRESDILTEVELLPKKSKSQTQS